MPNLIELIQNMLTGWGLGGGLNYFLSTASVVLVVILASWLADFITKKLILKALSKFVKTTTTKWDDAFLENRVFDRIAHIVPALIVYGSANIMFPELDLLKVFTQRLSLSYMMLLGALVISSILNAFLTIYRTWEIAKENPISAYVQVVKIIVFIIAVILILSNLIDRSPWVFLSGLGAMTAITLLVFKDTILGFVASIQLAANNMVRPGDWIEMPQYGADGDVIEVSINTIKVRNWDKTITTIPTYSLISDSFKNWRGMDESGGRRIKRHINIDMNSVKFCDREMLDRFRKIRHLKEYIESREKEIEEFNKTNNIDPTVKVNGRRQTNIGVFREYMKGYLRNHPKIHDGMTLLVRHLNPRENGLPIEIYAFSNDQVWANYEDIQADIFDHILAALPEFELRIFQNPSGRDFRRLIKELGDDQSD
ncbi:MAG: mechanosensitive ion channel family protein [Thermodesulfobacteriota bacterium]